MAKDWYVKQNNKVFGPIVTEKLKSLVLEGKIITQAEVANDKEGPWHPIGKLKGLVFPESTKSTSGTPNNSIKKAVGESVIRTSSSPKTPQVQDVFPTGKDAFVMTPMASPITSPAVPTVSSGAQSPARNDTLALLQYQANAKSAGVAYAFWFFLGMFGAHRFYAGKTTLAFVQLAITLISIPLIFVLIGFLTMAANAVWVLIDAFLISGWIRAYNSRLANSVAS